MIKTVRLFEDKNKGLTFYKSYIPSIAASGTSSVEMSIPSEVEINYLNIKCSSTDFDFHILNRSGSAIGSGYNIFSKTSIDKEFGPEAGASGITPFNLSIYFKNQDNVVSPVLYFSIVNNDGSNATGIITVELGVRQV